MRSYEVLMKNYIFNSDFNLSGPCDDFPIGWQKYKGKKNNSILWERQADFCNIKIQNHFRPIVSICQQRAYIIPVFGGQVWRIGLAIKSEKKLRVAIIVHFVSSSSRLIQTSLDLIVEPGTEYYYQVVTVPSGVDYAFLEIGLKDTGTIWVEEIEFIKVFPVGEYSTDNCCRLNINTVESVNNILEPLTVQNILEPVSVQGVIGTIRQTKDVFEDVLTGSEFRNSSVQDCLYLNTYSFCVVNMGRNNASVYMQISPDAVHWIDEKSSNNSLEAGESKVYVSNFFLRYARIIYIAEQSRSTNLRIFFQGNG